MKEIKFKIKDLSVNPSITAVVIEDKNYMDWLFEQNKDVYAQLPCGKVKEVSDFDDGVYYFQNVQKDVKPSFVVVFEPDNKNSNYLKDYIEVNKKLLYNPVTDAVYYKADDYVELDNGEYLVREYGKYKPNVCFLMTKPIAPEYEEEVMVDGVKLGKGICGDYWVSKKGNICFRPNVNGKYFILRERWGGSFCSKTISAKQFSNYYIYIRNASSNAGGYGYYYAIINKIRRLNHGKEN